MVMHYIFKSNKRMFKNLIKKPKHFKIIYVLLIIFTFCLVYQNIFDKKVSLVGDNASYYILGKAIATGEGYTNIHHAEKEAHYHYPIGYPVIIATTITLFSDSYTSIKLVNGGFLLGAILLLFFIIFKLTKNHHLAFITCLITIINYHVLNYATIMMSEIPFLFFSLLCLLIFIKLDVSRKFYKNKLFYYLIVVLAFTLLIRSVAIALCFTFIMIFMYKKKWDYVISSIIGITLLNLPVFLRNKNATGNTYISQLLLKNSYRPELGKVDLADILNRITLNFKRYLSVEIPSGIVYTKPINYTNLSVTKLDWALGICIVAAICFGLYKLKSQRYILLTYVVSFFAILMLWPNIWYGTRFLIPLIPILIFLVIYSVFEIIKICITHTLPSYKKSTPILITVMLLSFWAIPYGITSIDTLYTNAETDYPDNYKNYFSLAKWIDENTDNNSLTSVRKQGLFYLFSKKPVTGYLKTSDREAQIEDLKDKEVNYIIVEQLGYSSTYKYLLPAIDRYPEKFKIIKTLKDPNTYLMEFSPNLGYWGEWRQDKRNGWGTYVWEDGQVYKGFWKDNLRHGKGVVYFNNGEQLKGEWINGKLNGEVMKSDQNGNPLEKSLYKNNLKVKVIAHF